MIKEKTREQIEMELQELPIVQFAWLETEDLVFAEEARVICREECPRYGRSWSCPPGVGTVEECRLRCAAYDGAFVFSTIAEVTDAENLEETLATRKNHEAVTRGVQEIIGRHFSHTLPLSGESCEFCEQCAYPEAPCRYPRQRISCVEGYGIVVPSVAERVGIVFDNGYQTVTWFGIVLFL